MDLTTVLHEVDSWPVDDRIQLVQEVWDRLVDQGLEPGLTEAQAAEARSSARGLCGLTRGCRALGRGQSSGFSSSPAMSLPVVLLPEARTEFDEAFDWYELQRAGLGISFANGVQRVFDRISATPEMYRIVRQDVRKAGVRRFPYSVYYRIEATRIVVVAVFHGKRDPRVWQARI